jgi:hypothetical protein
MACAGGGEIVTRTRNAAFGGTSIGDGDIDAVNFTRVLREIVQDFHRVVDVVTGANGISAADTMNHDGTDGGGALLRLPSVNQGIQARIYIV